MENCKKMAEYGTQQDKKIAHFDVLEYTLIIGNIFILKKL